MTTKDGISVDMTSKIPEYYVLRMYVGPVTVQCPMDKKELLSLLQDLNYFAHKYDKKDDNETR